MCGYGSNSQASAAIAGNWGQSERTHVPAGPAVSTGGRSAQARARRPGRHADNLLTESVDGGLTVEKFF